MTKIKLSNKKEQGLYCVFCGGRIDGAGNNPRPVVMDSKARCCDDCNWAIVIPARLEGIRVRHVQI